ncbi:hypothetical protein LCGC14_2879100, partial [marine sediment metagenome]
MAQEPIRSVDAASLPVGNWVWTGALWVQQLGDSAGRSQGSILSADGDNLLPAGNVLKSYGGQIMELVQEADAPAGLNTLSGTT